MSVSLKIFIDIIISWNYKYHPVKAGLFPAKPFTKRDTEFLETIAPANFFCEGMPWKLFVICIN